MSITFFKLSGSPIFPGKVITGIKVLISDSFSVNKEIPVIICPSKYAKSALKPSQSIVLDVIPPLETK